jgi:hypothetical protein
MFPDFRLESFLFARTADSRSDDIGSLARGEIAIVVSWIPCAGSAGRSVCGTGKKPKVSVISAGRGLRVAAAPGSLRVEGSLAEKVSLAKGSGLNCGPGRSERGNVAVRSG